jgi:hypothetical protein
MKVLMIFDIYDHVRNYTGAYHRIESTFNSAFENDLNYTYKAIYIGYELEVMRGLDTDKIYCNYIVLENLKNDASYNSYMTGIGYEKISHHHYDSIYRKNKQD